MLGVEMKNFIKNVLQKLLGIHLYLLVFSLFVMIKLKWDKNEKDFLTFLKIIPNDGVILDIGANIGVMTRYFAKKKKKAQIFSFEPIPFNYKVLRNIVQIFRLRNVKTYKLAVGEKNETINMIVPKKGSVTMHGLCHVDDSEITQAKNFEKISAKMIKLDSFSDIVDEKKKLVSIKIDVENYEYHVLKGAEEIIDKHKPLIYTELWDNENRKKCIGFLQNKNYTVHVFENNEIIQYNKNHKGQNFVFLPN